MAITMRAELPAQVVFRTDRGTQYVSAQNAALKTEFYHCRVWPARELAKLEVGAWIEDRYRRRRAPIGQVNPVTFELQILKPDRGTSQSRIAPSTNREQVWYQRQPDLTFPTTPASSWAVMSHAAATLAA